MAILIYDGKCGFCAIWVRYWKTLTGERVTYAPSQEVGPQFPQIAPDEFKKSVWLVLPSGDVYHGAEAAFRLMAFVPGKSGWLWLFRNIPGFAASAEAGYRFIAAHRDFGYWVTRILWGKKVEPETYGRASAIFLRGLALVYLIAFLSLVPQIAGLLGAHGIQPVSQYLEAIRSQTGVARYWEVPTLAWLGNSDAVLKTICWTGAGLATLAFAGMAPWFSFLGCWILYLSIANAGQDFLSFQWDSLLLEVGFAALLIVPLRLRARYGADPPALGRGVLRIFLFRFMFESGMVKLLSGDPSWRNLSALSYHYETQPLPTPLAWYAYQLPAWFHKVCTAGVFAIELVVPFFFLLPRRFRLIGAWVTIAFQLAIAATGNYTFFNLLTILLCILLLDDRHLRRKSIPERGRQLRLAGTVVACFLIILGLLQLTVMAVQAQGFPVPLSWIDQEVETFRVVNTYGLFAVMTTTRNEIVVEGSDDGTNWKAYEFPYKPQDLRQRPRWVAPYQPRLDWQMWFAALSNFRDTPWFSSFAYHLLEGTPEVLGLLKTNPFPDHPPKFIRAELYEYHFSSAAGREASGVWWTRTYAGEFLPASSLRGGQ